MGARVNQTLVEALAPGRVSRAFVLFVVGLFVVGGAWTTVGTLMRTDRGRL